MHQFAIAWMLLRCLWCGFPSPFEHCAAFHACPFPALGAQAIGGTAHAARSAAGPTGGQPAWAACAMLAGMCSGARGWIPNSTHCKMFVSWFLADSCGAEVCNIVAKQHALLVVFGCTGLLVSGPWTGLGFTARGRSGPDVLSKSCLRLDWNGVTSASCACPAGYFGICTDPS